MLPWLQQIVGNLWDASCDKDPNLVTPALAYRLLTQPFANVCCSQGVMGAGLDERTSGRAVDKQQTRDLSS